MGVDMNIIKGYRKDKGDTSIPTYYVNKAQYNGDDYKQFLKEIALDYDVRLEVLIHALH